MSCRVSWLNLTGVGRVLPTLVRPRIKKPWSIKWIIIGPRIDEAPWVRKLPEKEEEPQASGLNFQKGWYPGRDFAGYTEWGKKRGLLVVPLSSSSAPELQGPLPVKRKGLGGAAVLTYSHRPPLWVDLVTIHPGPHPCHTLLRILQIRHHWIQRPHQLWGM